MTLGNSISPPIWLISVGLSYKFDLLSIAWDAAGLCRLVDKMIEDAFVERTGMKLGPEYPVLGYKLVLHGGRHLLRYKKTKVVIANIMRKFNV